MWFGVLKNLFNFIVIIELYFVSFDYFLYSYTSVLIYHNGGNF